MAQESGLQQKSSFQLQSTLAGNRCNIRYTRLDAKNYLKERRQRSMVYGEVGCVMEYFQQQLLDCPSFFHAYQMDCDEQITNVFWADAKMILDYAYFGDVVSLDTTYCTNRANRPLALFTGFDHDRTTIIYGATLLYDETADSFKWLFETFLEVHNHKKPITMFTDQDQAMAKALVEVMPETHHSLCTWHLMQNEIKHLGNLMKGGSHFLRDFKKCMYDFDTFTDFEKAWTKIVQEYNVHDNNWINSLYAIKEKWASCYMKEVVTLGMQSTQLSESLNSDFKASMKPSVFEANDVKAILEKYILKRWTKEGRSGIINNFIRREIEGDPKVATTQRYRQLAFKMIRLASEVSSSEEYSTLVDECLNVVCRQISHFRLQTQHVDSDTDNHASKLMINDGTIPKGFKHRPSLKRNTYKRFKSWVELQGKRKRNRITRGQLQNQHAKEYQPSPPSEPCDIHCSTPPSYHPPQTLNNQFNFTTLLTDPLDDTTC
ncbi:protein FAR1-RELATED SEQUENCE 5-like [Abrus precatorius]|uniref:Protein FAR1-RELATED SEQUENCE 5-like n=1 Tax=Abrus precatorius TaxID=3816 RepID=A0A8B8K4T8_ABRPR|nr:protein FAR1-RELATED SEQUENCE 5-like [Abrus precatorius]